MTREMMTIAGLALLVAAPAWGRQAAPERRLAGDPRAVAAIERMIERFGGRAVWARARSLYVEYDGRRSRPAEPVVERAWRNLREPHQRSVYQGRTFHIEYVLNPERTWTIRNWDTTVAAAEHHRSVVERYPFGFYTSLHTLAAADPRVQLAWREPNMAVVITVADNRERGWWVVDDTGELLRWGAPRPDTGSVEYVYGPMRPFGTVNFPAWGASADGWWRWNYVAVAVSPEPFVAPRAPAARGDRVPPP